MFKSKIDMLVGKNAKLLVAQRRIEDRKNKKNQTMEARINWLTQCTYRNNEISGAKIKELKRKIQKNMGLIENEKKYYNELTHEDIGGENE